MESVNYCFNINIIKLISYVWFFYDQASSQSRLLRERQNISRESNGNGSVYRCTHSIVPTHCTQKVPRTIGNAFKRALTSAENVKRDKLKSRKTISKGLRTSRKWMIKSMSNQTGDLPGCGIHVGWFPFLLCKRVTPSNQKADLLGCGINGFLFSSPLQKSYFLFHSPLQKSYFFFLFRTRFFRGFEVFEDARNSVENELSSVPSYIVIIASFKVRYRKFEPRKRYMPFDIGKIASFQMKYRQKKCRNRYLPFDIGVLASFQIGYRNF